MISAGAQMGTRRSWPASIAAGVGLGLLAVLTDALTGVPHIALLGLTDKGFAWALVALVIGLNAPTARSAVGQGASSLATATLAYYGFILAATDRWRGGVPIDGSDAVWYGLMSVARATAFWLLAALTVGGGLGWVGFGICHLSPSWTHLLAGAAAGALASGGLHSLVWGNWAIEPFWWVQPLMAAATVIISIAVAITALGRRRKHSWHLFLPAFAISLAVCTSLWYAVTSLRLSHL